MTKTVSHKYIVLLKIEMLKNDKCNLLRSKQEMESDACTQRSEFATNILCDTVICCICIWRICVMRECPRRLQLHHRSDQTQPGQVTLKCLITRKITNSIHRNEKQSRWQFDGWMCVCVHLELTLGDFECWMCHFHVFVFHFYYYFPWYSVRDKTIKTKCARG